MAEFEGLCVEVRGIQNGLRRHQGPNPLPVMREAVVKVVNCDGDCAQMTMDGEVAAAMLNRRVRVRLQLVEEAGE